MCDNRVADMKVLEMLSVDEYYQTITTWMKIMDEKAKAYEGKGGGKSSDGDGVQRRKMKGK
jgi:hypothetical protein